ncbi:MAG: 99, gp99 [Thermoleophilia bacterium]|jgi:glutamine phosphoribosylpyrophosphate amidotransferase|nr:99, gp99 [Thermoleophilia bacterium]
MCGIAGFSFNEECTIDASHAARVLLSSVAERGADAAGCTYELDGRLVVEKQPGGASRFLEDVTVPHAVRQLLLHVRDFTKGRPSLMANNHPIRHGDVVGVHNGKISNDDAIFNDLARARFEPGMTVDSEAIFAALDDADGNEALALERLRGALACGWFDERRPGSVFLARGYGRPLWLATTTRGDAVLWASTLQALEIVEDFLAIRLHKRPLSPGSILEIRDGKLVARRAFRADARAEWLLNPVASPEEKRIAIARLDESRDEHRLEDGARIA